MIDHVSLPTHTLLYLFKFMIVFTRITMIIMTPYPA